MSIIEHVSDVSGGPILVWTPQIYKTNIVIDTYWPDNFWQFRLCSLAVFQETGESCNDDDNKKVQLCKYLVVVD